jgi:hypothetical protein
MSGKDMRSHPRTVVKEGVGVNGGKPYQGGMLYDMSIGGASVTYPKDINPADTPLVVGQTLMLVVGDGIRFPAKIVRVFDGGFATQFDFSLTI